MEPIKYDIVSAGVGVHGTYLVKVCVYTTFSNISDDQLKYAAIHGVIFRGFSGNNGVATQHPMVKDITIEHTKADYFKAFFDPENGPYLNYATIINGSYERVKTANKEYKIGAVIQINKNNLKHELEQAGIIRKLSSGF